MPRIQRSFGMDFNETVGLIALLIAMLLILPRA